jgi:GNAT superfamily N-acetyltransferase
MPITIEPLDPQRSADALDALARLRIAVFREFPYLYDGDLAYEQRYLARFAKADGAVIVAAFEDGRMVGAATGAPLAGQLPQFAEPFAARGHDLASLFYFGESVLLPAWRGRGLGHRFFDAREAHARSLGGFTRTTFCAVVRPEDHPLRPKDYRPLDAFWQKRGYQKVEGLVGRFAWKDLGEEQETEKPMQFWLRELAPAAQ